MVKKRGNIEKVNVISPLTTLIRAIFWITGVLVSLAVGFGMIDGVLSIRYIPEIIVQVAGWIVVILAILGVVLKIIDSMSK